jgi:hypothetical protein
MYILAVGECKASISTGQYEREVKRYKPGDYFGELALMDNAPRAANVDALTDITCLRISSREFHRVLGGTAAYTIMERNAAKDRAIQAEVMAHHRAMAFTPQPTAPPPAAAPPPQQAQLPPLPPLPNVHVPPLSAPPSVALPTTPAPAPATPYVPHAAAPPASAMKAITVDGEAITPAQ